MKEKLLYTESASLKEIITKWFLSATTGCHLAARTNSQNEMAVGGWRRTNAQRKGLSQFARKTNWNFNRPPYPIALNASNATLPTLKPSLPPRCDPSLTSVLLFPTYFLFFIFSSPLRERAKCFYARRYYVPPFVFKLVFIFHPTLDVFLVSSSFPEKTVQRVNQVQLLRSFICNLISVRAFFVY